MAHGNKESESDAIGLTRRRATRCDRHYQMMIQTMILKVPSNVGTLFTLDRRSDWMIVYNSYCKIQFRREGAEETLCIAA